MDKIKDLKPASVTSGNEESSKRVKQFTQILLLLIFRKILSKSIQTRQLEYLAQKNYFINIRFKIINQPGQPFWLYMQLYLIKLNRSMFVFLKPYKTF